MKSAIYVRCSTEHQTTENGGVSIENQLARCREYVERRRWTLVEEIVDEGISGGVNKARKGFIRLLDCVERGDIDVVVLFSLERLSRDMLTLLALEKLLDEYEVQIHSVEGFIDTSTPDGFMSFAMKAFMGEMERRQVKHRTRQAMAYKKRNGKVVGPVPYGYRRKDKDLIPDVNEQRIIKTVNAQYRAGTRLVDIVTRLNEDGEVTRSGRAWTATQVKRLIPDYENCWRKSQTRISTAARGFIEAIA